MISKRISVVGAYGYTGQLICEQFDRHHVFYTIVGRNESKLIELSSKLINVNKLLNIDIQIEKECDLLIENSDIIVNCAGPFTEESQVLLNKIATSGKIYFDISGELEFIKNSREKFHLEAIRNRSLIIHACAFESFVIDLVLQKMKVQNDKYKAIRTFYFFENTKASPGTRITMKLAKFRKKLKISNNNWQEYGINESTFNVDFSTIGKSLKSIIYPLPEVAFAYWNCNAESIESLLLVKPEEAVFVIPRISDEEKILPTLKLLSERKVSGPSIEERKEQKCEIILFLGQHDGIENIFKITSHDMYETTAMSIVISVLELMKNNKSIFGVLNPAKLFLGKEDEILSLLHVEVSVENSIVITSNNNLS